MSGFLQFIIRPPINSRWLPGTVASPQRVLKEHTMSGLILVSHNQCQRSTLNAIYDGILSRQGGVWIS